MCFQSAFFIYSYQFEYVGGWTPGPKASLASALASPNTLRAHDFGDQCIARAGWHCSHCFR